MESRWSRNRYYQFSGSSNENSYIHTFHFEVGIEQNFITNGQCKLVKANNSIRQLLLRAHKLHNPRWNNIRFIHWKLNTLMTSHQYYFPRGFKKKKTVIENMLKGCLHEREGSGYTGKGGLRWECPVHLLATTRLSNVDFSMHTLTTISNAPMRWSFFFSILAHEWFGILFMWQCIKSNDRFLSLGT